MKNFVFVIEMLLFRCYSLSASKIRRRLFAPLCVCFVSLACDRVARFFCHVHANVCASVFDVCWSYCCINFPKHYPFVAAASSSATGSADVFAAHNELIHLACRCDVQFISHILIASPFCGRESPLRCGLLAVAARWRRSLAGRSI